LHDDPKYGVARGRSISQDDNDIPVAEAKVSATELGKRFRTDAASAQKEFGQRIIEVHGIVKDVRSPEKDVVAVVLMDDRKVGQIVCKLSRRKA